MHHATAGTTAGSAKHTFGTHIWVVRLALASPPTPDQACPWAAAQAAAVHRGQSIAAFVELHPPLMEETVVQPSHLMRRAAFFFNYIVRAPKTRPRAPDSGAAKPPGEAGAGIRSPCAGGRCLPGWWAQLVSGMGPAAGEAVQARCSTVHRSFQEPPPCCLHS